MAVTHPEFNEETEGLEVAKAFADGIRGKTVLVTGVNLKGIGFTTAEAFASQAPAHLIICGRNPSRMQDSIDALKSKYPNVDYRPLKLDLGSQKAVRAAADELLAWDDIPAIDIVVNSAGIMNIPQRTINEDGIEIQFGTNHVGHFLFTNLIMPKLIEAAKNNPKGATRVVNVSSASPTVAAMRWSDMTFEKVNNTLPEAEQPNYAIHLRFGAKDPETKAYLPLEGYNQSKVGNLLFAIGINKRLYEKYGILSFTVHPGIIPTELSRDAAQETIDAIKAMEESGFINWKTLGAGSSTSLVAAVDPKLGPGETKDGKENVGTYLMDCQVSDKARDLACSSEQAEKLWKYSEELVKQQFTW